jgi:hypothetical protein
MEKMEANRRCTTLSRPELFRCQVGDDRKDVLAHLHDGMRGGLEQGDDPIEGSA